jgi:hypothetical protein
MKRLFCNPVSLLAILIAAPLGCADSGEANERSLSAAIETFVPHQGRLLLGFKNPDIRVFSFANTVPSTKAVNGQLVASGLAGTAFTGVTFSGTDGLTTADMRIAQVIPPTQAEPRWQYVIEQRIPNTASWEPACDSPTPLIPSEEPQHDPPRALAMSGLWFGPLYWVQPSFVTFACETGVVAKCNGWGFPVDKQWPHVTKHGLTTFASGADIMQACSRMARADYCAGGMPNTLDGTPIQIDDVFKGVQPHDGFTFEAAWPGKAIHDSSPRPLPAICLTKLRWSTLPLGGNCPLLVPDPRVDSKGTFCDDMTPLDIERQGALLYSSSSFIDAGLYTYTDPATKLHLTTASLLPRKNGEPAEWQLPQPPAINFPTPGQPVRFEATIFAPALPASIPDDGLRKLISYHCESDLITTTSEVRDPSCKEIALEGYVYPPNAPGRAPLRRWFNPALKSSTTTTASPTTMMADGWKLAEVVGGVLRAGVEVNLRWSELVGYSYAVEAQTAAGAFMKCIDSAQIGSSPGFLYRGVCVGNANFPLNHADILAFRVTYTRPGFPTLVATEAYDGFSRDAYVTLEAPDAQTTAINVAWKDLGEGLHYAVDTRLADGEWLRCADTDLVANGTSYVHTGRCWSPGVDLAPRKIIGLRVCAIDPDNGTEHACVETEYDGRASRVAFAIKD